VKVKLNTAYKMGCKYDFLQVSQCMKFFFLYVIFFQLRDCELGAIVNRDLSRRIRTVNGITSHRQVVRHDIKLSARIVHNLDAKAGLWIDGDLPEAKGEFVPEGDSKKLKEKEPDQMPLPVSFGMLSCIHIYICACVCVYGTVVFSRRTKCMTNYSEGSQLIVRTSMQ